MDFQDTIAQLESIKERAVQVDPNTVPFYQQWQKGVTMAMKGNLEVNSTHTTAYIEGLLDAISFLEMQYLERIYNNMYRDRLPL